MKYNKVKIFFSAILFASFILLGACSDYVDTEIASPMVSGDNPSVYFVKENATRYELEPGENAEFTLTVERANGSSALDVPIKVITNPDASFIVPDKVSFASGAKIANFVVKMSPTAKTGSPLGLELAFDESNVNPYLVEYGSYIAQVTLLKWVKYSIGTFTSEFFEDSWEQELFKAEGTNKFRFKNLYAEGYDYDFEWEVDKAKIAFAANKSIQESGYVHSSYGMVSTNTDAAKSAYDGNNSTFSFYIKWTVSAGSFGEFVDTYKVTQKF